MNVIDIALTAGAIARIVVESGITEEERRNLAEQVAAELSQGKPVSHYVMNHYDRERAKINPRKGLP